MAQVDLIKEQLDYENSLAKPQTNYRWIVCALLFFATTINYVDRQILSLLKERFRNKWTW